MMFLDDEAPTTGGREIWGFPKKIGNPDLSVIHDTLTGTLRYAEHEVALGTMAYKYQSLAQDHGETLAAMRQAQRQPEIHPRCRWLAEDRPVGGLSSGRHRR